MGGVGSVGAGAIALRSEGETAKTSPAFTGKSEMAWMVSKIEVYFSKLGPTRS